MYYVVKGCGYLQFNWEACKYPVLTSTRRLIVCKILSTFEFFLRHGYSSSHVIKQRKQSENLWQPPCKIGTHLPGAVTILSYKCALCALDYLMR